MSLPQIQIGDGLLGDATIASVEVRQSLNQHWWCKVVCRDTEDSRIPTEDLLGQTVEIRITDQSGTEHVQFTGFIQDVSLTYEVWGSYTATLLAVSDSYRMDLARHKQYYLAGTLASLAGTLGGRSGTSVTVNVPASKALNYVQYGETDFAFLNRIVDDYGAWLRPKQGGVEVFNTFQSGATLQWRDPEGLIEFDLSATLVPPTVSGAHYDHHAMQSKTFQQVSKPPQFFDGAASLTGIIATASQQLPAAFEPQRARAMTVDDYDAQLQSENERALGSAVTGTGSSRNPALTAGDTVQIDGTLDAKGTYGLVDVTHEWTPHGYSNTFHCTPWKNYRHPKPPAAHSWEGVVPARVVNHDDPKKMGRLQVQFFWQEDGVMHWARAISPHAGPDRGMMFMPEVGDEVAVMFEDGDPERPVIVGSLWNGVHQAPRTGFFAADADIPDNNVKRFVTRSGNRFQLIDTPAQETVVMATPHHTKLLLTEKSLNTTRPMLHIHSDGDIVFSASGRIHLQGAFVSRQVGDAASMPVTIAPPPDDPLAGKSCAQKMQMALESSSGGKAIMDAMGGKKGIAIFVAMLGGAAVIQAIPVAGEVEDVLAVIGGAVALGGLLLAGHNVWKGLQQLKAFKDYCCGQAKTPADLQRAGQMGADAIAEIGINTIFALLSAKPIAKGIKAVPKVVEGAPPTRLGLSVDEPIRPTEPPTPEKLAAIKAMKNGTRPDPKTYIPAADYDNQLALFKNGATRVMPESVFKKYGPAREDGTSFVMPKDQMDALIESSKSDPSILENALGLKPGSLADTKMVRVDIADPEANGLTFPSGNEKGASDLWLPGGKLPTGLPEAVVKPTPGSFTSSPIN